jgi:RNA polymerase sigma factor (sigma-70 family)
MSEARADVLLRHIRRLAGAQKNGNLPDRELLEHFLTQGDEAAFATLVRRHGAMVLGVCRAVLHQQQDAEDVFQATFLVLARKAASVRKREALASWLHGVARRLALKLRARAARRPILTNGNLDLLQARPMDDLTWRELRLVLHKELDRLPERYRSPLVLCHLEGKTQDEAAHELGWTSGMLRGRLLRGRDLLRARLIRRGLALSVPLFAAVLSQEQLVAALPATLANATVKAALLSLTGPATIATISTQAAALAEEGLAIMLVTKLKFGAALLLTLGVLAVGAGWGMQQARETKEREAQRQEVPRAEVKNADELKTAAAPAAAAKPMAAPMLGVVVLDPQGKPLSGAKVHSSIWTNEKGFKANHDYETDAAGAVQVQLPKNFYILRLWASKKPFVTMFAGWEQNELASGKQFPAEYTLRLESGVAAGGRIVDEQGKPIAGAKVEVVLTNDPKPVNGDGRTRYDTWLAAQNEAATTDAEGRWRISNVPDHPQAKLSLLVSHPDYVSDERRGEAQKAAGITTAMLQQETATLTLKRGVIVRGRVTDSAGKPIQDAIIVRGDNPSFASTPSQFPTDADGQFRLPALPPRETELTAIAPGWAPQLRPVKLHDGLPPQDFRMELGKPIQLRIVDGAGKPVPNAYVSIVEWKGRKSLSPGNVNHPKRDNKIPRAAKADGVWEWTWAPADPVKLEIGKKGFASCELEMAGGASTRTVVLKAEHRVTGLVTDAVMRKPIPAFTVIPIDVFRKDFLHAERGNAVAGKDGRLDFLATRTDIPLRLRVEAPGYRTQHGPEFRVGDDAARTQDFRLQPSPLVAGVVLDAAGLPVAKAEVLVATPTEQATLSQDDNHRLFTDAAGRFVFPDPGEPFAVLGQAAAGFALAEFKAGQHDAGALRLQPWASVRGRFHDGGQPVRNATILLQPVRIDSLYQPRIDAMLQTVTGADGRFDFARVPPVPVSVRIYLGPWKDEGFRSGPSVPLELKPGQQADLDLGDAGVVVKGKVTLTGKVPDDLDCTYSLNYLVRRAPGIAPPAAIANLGFDARNGWRDTWRKTSEGLTYLSTLQHWFVQLAPDGAFRISGVPPGEYDLAVEVYAKPNGCLVDPLARNVVSVTVTAADAARGELVLPEIAAAVAPVPAVGDAAALSFQRVDGTAGTLADCRGRHTVVHFWASWCGPCKQQLPALGRLQERFAARGLATLSLSLDDDQAAWQAGLKRLDLPWPQGRLAAASHAGVSSVPAYWLLDPAGKIVAKVNDTDELATYLADRLKRHK